jgi:hypothetical protein
MLSQKKKHEEVVLAQDQQDLPESTNMYHHKTCGIMTDDIDTYFIITIRTLACALMYSS